MEFVLNIPIRGISMNTKALADILFRFYEYLISINKPIFGKTLFEWIKLAFLYSFVIWLIIFGWKVYNDYLYFKKLKDREESLASISQQKSKLVYKYSLKLRDIQLAYSQISKTFSEDKVKELLKELNNKIWNLEKKKKFIDIYNPLSFNGINYQMFVKMGKKIDVYIPKFYFSVEKGKFSSIVQAFLNSINYFLGFNKTAIKGKVKVSLIGKKIVLFFSPKGNSILSLKPVTLLGLVQKPEKLEYIPTYLFFDVNSYESKELTNIFIGWSFEVKKEVLNNEIK